MTDARTFNIRDEDGSLVCPACGFAGYANHPAYDENGGLIGTTICACCLWEPGFDDDPIVSRPATDSILDSLRAHRARWSRALAWLGRDDLQPATWNPHAQLAKLFEIAPHVR